MLIETSYQALIQLMDDPDEQVYAHVKELLFDAGVEAVPLLELGMEEGFSLLFHHRAERLIREIQFEEIKKQLTKWIAADEKSLLEGALIVARYQYPNLDTQKVYDTLEKIRKAIWLELSPISTAYEKVAVINQVLFEMFGFDGNKMNYYTPVNSYLNSVLELKVGNPLSLSVLYSVLAEKLDIPIYGVNLPNHFVLAYMDELNINAMMGNENKYGVLFYIDPFSKGELLCEEDIREFLTEMKLSPSRACFEPCSNSQILQRMLSNLMFSYKRINNPQKVEELRELTRLFS